MGASVVAVLCGCGALVGVHDLDVVNDGSGAQPDAKAPPAKDAGSTPTDAGNTDVDSATTPPVERPPPGSYTYTISGSDGLKGSFGGGGNAYTQATLTIELEGEDCFKQTLHIRAGYDETYHFCRRGPEFAMDKGDRDQTIYGYRAQTSQTCTPGDVYFPQIPIADPPYQHTCTGKNNDNQSGDSTFTTAGKYTYVGPEQIPIGGTNVDVRHFHDERDVSGAQTGTNKADWWFSAKSGVLVRLQRHIDVSYKFGAFNTNYVEDITDMTINAPPP